MFRDPDAIRRHYAEQREALARAMDLVSKRRSLPTDAVAYAVQHHLPIWAVKVAIRSHQDDS